MTVDTKRDATRGAGHRLREENEALKKAVPESVLDGQRLKKVSACERTVHSDDTGTDAGDPSFGRVFLSARKRGVDKAGSAVFHSLSMEGQLRETRD